MDTSSGGPQSNGGAIAEAVISGRLEPTSSDAGGAVVIATTSPECDQDLPVRPIPARHLVRKIRPLDDPEILQRVLAGLLNLQ